MPTTSLGLRYPSSTSAVDVPTDIGNLASDTNALFVTNNTFVTRKDGVQSVVSISPSASIGTSQAIILTLTNCLFQTGRAYSIECVGGLYGDVAGRLADLGVYKTNLAGTQYGAINRVYAGGLNKQTNAYARFYVIRSAGTDLTTDIVLGMVADAGAVIFDAGSFRPRALVVRDVGSAASYAGFFAVT